MNKFIQNITGMGGITDQVITTDLLLAAKSGIIIYSVAITETLNPELREVLKEQLNIAINLHAQVSDFMMAKGYYNPHDINKQFNIDYETAQTALNLQ
ncbi:MAG: spore gernimation protein GerQ [Bacillales bacterium]|jgi:similar to spore coat protein|nr:spore gernimation protein GerQ [Bacillales bacterium]